MSTKRFLGDAWLYHNCDMPGCPVHDPHCFLDFDWIKLRHTMIHYFGLGFIQVKLGSKTRMHFYTKELPAIVPEEDIHNHRYGFHSFVMRGELNQDIFEVKENYQLIPAEYFIHYESCDPKSKAPKLKLPAEVRLVYSANYNVGSSYAVDSSIFHRVHSENAVTFLHRGPYEQQYARIVRYKDSPEICPFSKEVAKEDLWRIVKKML